ncbi:MAG TPA: anti-sigma factor antagonist [Desulfovibrio sp.]|jgi:anti-sigma B factor antagonist|nr:anti-sigma factor antagonist [Desulfovibrio sp.]
MQFESAKQGKYVLIKASGRMDAASSPEFERECGRWIGQGESFLAVDLAGVDYLSSAGLRSILAMAKQLKLRQGEIRFCGLSGMVQEVFAVSGFSSMFKVVPSGQPIDKD